VALEGPEFRHMPIHDLLPVLPKLQARAQHQSLVSSLVLSVILVLYVADRPARTIQLQSSCHIRPVRPMFRHMPMLDLPLLPKLQVRRCFS
jgi:hypothetical protein